MSWLEHSKDRSRLLKGAAVAVIASVLSLGISGCGFHPMYATNATDGSSLIDAMKAVQIAPIGSRMGQRLRNELIFGTTGAENRQRPFIGWTSRFGKSVRNTLVMNTGAPTGQILQLDAEFRLVRIKDNETRVQGLQHRRSGLRPHRMVRNYRLHLWRYPGNLDAENRAARSLADTLKTRVAAFLSRDT